MKVIKKINTFTCDVKLLMRPLLAFELQLYFSKAIQPNYVKPLYVFTKLDLTVKMIAFIPLLELI